MLMFNDLSANRSWFTFSLKKSAFLIQTSHAYILSFGRKILSTNNVIEKH